MKAPTYRDAKILSIDDQESNLRLVEHILKQGGYTCWRNLRDSRQTFSVFQEFRPDLILLDLMMGPPDGVAVLEQLRPLVEGTYLPVLVLTADVTPAARRRALAAGAKDFLTKPLDPIEMLLRIENLLETRFLYQKLQRRTERVQEQAALLDQANDAILVCDPQDRILSWNQGAERLYGWRALDVVGRNTRDLLFRAPAADLEKARQGILREGKWEGELRQVTKDRREIVVASRWTLVRDAQGRPRSYLIINTDATEKKKLEAQLVQVQRLEAVGLLAGGVAHDFNNLLTVILGCSEMVLGALPRGEPAHDLVQQVRSAGKKAAALTRQLLAFSRKQVLAPVVLDLNDLVSETEKLLRRLIGEDVVLSTVLDPTLGRVHADPGQLEQVLMNLAVNARDAMPTGGYLTLETRNVDLEVSAAPPHAERQPGRWVMLAVRDTGSGMDEATRARIFEPFFTTKEAGRGTGLGLATVYGIVKQSGGFIEVDTAPGRGTTFKVYLPFLAEEATQAQASGPALHTLAQGTGTVLLVEDEETVRSLACVVLRLAGYEVLEARNGKEALEACRTRTESIDLLVTDVVMPEMSGRELLNRVAALRPGLKVLFMSGYTDDTVLRHGVREGATEFLPKPFTPSLLARKVHEVLGR